MQSERRQPAATRRQLFSGLLAAVVSVLLPLVVAGQGLTGTLIGKVTDQQEGVLAGAVVRVSSPALIGGPVTQPSDHKGQLRFLALPPGTYVLDIELVGFTPHHEEDIYIGAGATIEKPVVLELAGIAQSVVVEGAGSRIDARNPGFGNRFGPEDLRAIPTRRASMFDLIRASPGISPTSPASGTATTVSAFGSGTNENQFLIDGTNFTCPCNGVARAEPGIDFIQEIHVQSVGASAEYGNVQGAVINVVSRSGSNRFLYDASYYGQTAGLTSQPVRLPYPGSGQSTSGYERARYRDVTTNLGGPVVRDRLWFFAGYQHLRDYDSQPGSDPQFPRTYEQDKIFAKLTWRLAPGWQLVQSFHDEFWVNPEQPTSTKPYEATLRLHATVPAMTFGHLTRTMSANTVWDVRVGRFVYSREDDPSTGDLTTPSRLDRVTGVTSGAPQSFGGLTLIRTTAKATINHYRARLLGADHQWKTGVQVERGEGHGPNIIPTGVRYEDRNGAPFRAISSDPSHSGGLFITAGVFASDAITVGDRMTINAGVRFDHSRAISQDVHALDAEGHEMESIIPGQGTLYTWNLWSPRLGVTTKLTADGRALLRGSYGRFSQGVLTGEFSSFHPGVTPISTRAFEQSTGGYTRFESEVSSKNLLLNPDMRAPHTDEYSVGVDREVGRRLTVAIAYVHKSGTDFVGWTDVGGQYREETRTLANGQIVPVSVLVNSTADRRFLLSNPAGYSLTYNGIVTAVEKRRSHGWQAFGSYTFSRTSGLQASSGATAAGAQSSTVALPSLPFGRDPNDLTNARGRLPNDRPHILRLMGTVDIPRSGLTLAANVQSFSGKPWAATTQISLPQNSAQRVQLEPRGSRRLSSQTLIDVRLSRPITLGRSGRIELLLDVLNLLNDTAAEGLTSDVLATESLKNNPDFGTPNVFMDPRRAMIGVRLNLGR